MSEDTRVRDRVELGAGVLLAAATVASAWCAYQASLWSGEQLRSLSAANTAHFESLRKTADANVATMVDVTTFLDYLESVSRGQQQLAEFIRNHARLEFRPVLNAWIAERESGKDQPDLPFKPPRYRLAATLEAESLEKQASTAIETANQANANGDLFVLHTVMFALALFFLGTTSEARQRRVRIAMLVFGTLVFVGAIVSMARIPRAPSQRLQARAAAIARTGA